jgi:hypothetical protein
MPDHTATVNAMPHPGVEACNTVLMTPRALLGIALLLAGCGAPPTSTVTTQAPPAVQPQPAPPPAAQARPQAAPKAAQPAPPAAAAVAPKLASPTAPPPAQRATASAKPPPPAAAPAQAARPALDLKSLEQRLKETSAIGVLTKLSLKNQVDDLVERFRTFHGGQRPPTLAQLRPAFELLLMKVLSLLQDKDGALAADIHASREAIWGVLADREKFSRLT